MDDDEVESDDFGSRRAGFVAPEARRGIVTRCTKLASLRHDADDFSTSGPLFDSKSGFCCCVGEIMCTSWVGSLCRRPALLQIQ